MPMDGCNYSGLKFPFVSSLFHTRGLSSASWPLAAGNVTTAVFHHAVSFQRHVRLPGLCIHAAILDLTVGSATYGMTLTRPVTPRTENHAALRKQETCMQRLNSCRTDVSLDLESQILDFMGQSERPDLFPSRSELLKSGRSDLVEAILARGGWMVAGWDLEEEDQSCDDIIINGMTKTETGNETAGDIQESQSGCLGDRLVLVDKTEMRRSPQALSSLERQRAWERLVDLFGLSSSTKPEHDEKPAVLANKEISRKWPNVLNGPPALAQLEGVPFNSGSKDLTGPSLAGGNKGSSLPSKASERKKIRRGRPSKLSNRRSNDNKGWVDQIKCNDAISHDGEPNKGNEKSISLQIQGLESELVSFLDTMKSGRGALNDDIKLKQSHGVHNVEIEEVSDALEFCETQLMNKKRELRTARAQRTAIEGKLALDMMEFKRTMEKKDKHFEQAMEVLKTLRIARIIWPNAGREVFLAGSYDGWASRKRMEKSSAGVFVTTLQLYPGHYEIKFIVDGVWITDPIRPRTWANGFENNVLTIV